MASIFTKIINRELPAQIIYEDERFIAILDINPVNPGHTLVITKTDVPHFAALDTELVGPLFAVVQQVAHAIVSGTGADGFNVMTSNGQAAGQEIEHLHIHIIPRFEGDGFRHWSSEPYENPEQMAQVAEAIRRALTEDDA